jgi:hypothetical protein
VSTTGRNLNRQPEEPTPTTRELINRGGRVASNCELLDVRPTRLSAELFASPHAACQVKVDIAASCRLDDTSRLAIYETDFNVSVISGDQLVAALSARFVATFQLAEGFVAEPDEYQAFGDVTVLMSMFPYLREYVHSTASRLGLHGVVLGLIRQPAAQTLQARTPNQVRNQPNRQIAETKPASRSKSKR